jgi:hypothetical protein
MYSLIDRKKLGSDGFKHRVAALNQRAGGIEAFKHSSIQAFK